MDLTSSPRLRSSCAPAAPRRDGSQQSRHRTRSSRCPAERAGTGAGGGDRSVVCRAKDPIRSGLVERPESGKDGACPPTLFVARGGLLCLYTAKRGSSLNLLLTWTTSSTRSVTLDMGTTDGRTDRLRTKEPARAQEGPAHSGALPRRPAGGLPPSSVRN